MATRRELRFDSLDDVVRDAETLLARGYDKAGTWDLAQVCGHLANWLTYPLDGFPRPPLPVRLILAVMRNMVGKRELRRVLDSGRMPAGGPTVRESVPPAGGDPAAAVARLRAAAERFRDHPGPVRPSPLFGALTRDEATRLQLVHCAHHLSFLIPKQG
jgi:hypothetical protein